MNIRASQVTFGETSTGAAMVQGSFVAQGASTSSLTHTPSSSLILYSTRTDGWDVWEQGQRREQGADNR